MVRVGFRMLVSGTPPFGCHQSFLGAMPELARAAGNLVLEKEAASAGPL